MCVERGKPRSPHSVSLLGLDPLRIAYGLQRTAHLREDGGYPRWRKASPKECVKTERTDGEETEQAVRTLSRPPNHHLWKFTQRMTDCTVQPATMRQGQKRPRGSTRVLPSGPGPARSQPGHTAADRGQAGARMSLQSP